MRGTIDAWNRPRHTNSCQNVPSETLFPRRSPSRGRCQSMEAADSAEGVAWRPSNSGVQGGSSRGRSMEWRAGCGISRMNQSHCGSRERSLVLPKGSATEPGKVNAVVTNRLLLTYQLWSGHGISKTRRRYNPVRIFGEPTGGRSSSMLGRNASVDTKPAGAEHPSTR
jgi:hypothetical protein